MKVTASSTGVGSRKILGLVTRRRKLMAAIDSPRSICSRESWRTRNAELPMEKTSMGGDSPWLLINSGGGAGALYAYEDRLVIAKVGALTSFMADSFGAGRVSTLPFNQITGIEYNGGMVSGVLEVLTPSYQGTKNQDYWRGTGAKRNTDRNSPWTLSNTLPLGVSEYKNAEAAINELRAKIIAYQRPSVTVNAPVAPANDLATQISNLKQLLDQGALTQAEFEKAKQKLLDA